MGRLDEKVAIITGSGAGIGKEIAHTYAKEGAKVNIIVNNAGVGDNMQAAGNVEDNVWERVMSINVDGVMRITRKAIPLFLENGGGTFVNMASISGLTGGRGGFTYTAAKHAVV